MGGVWICGDTAIAAPAISLERVYFLSMNESFLNENFFPVFDTFVLCQSTAIENQQDESKIPAICPNRETTGCQRMMVGIDENVAAEIAAGQKG